MSLLENKNVHAYLDSRLLYIYILSYISVFLFHLQNSIKGALLKSAFKAINSTYFWRYQDITIRLKFIILIYG